MNLSDLFGEGASYSGGILSVPLNNLYAIGLTLGNTDKVSLATALLLLPLQYFQGNLIDSDGKLIIDFDDAAILYDQNRIETTINYQFMDKKLSNDEKFLFFYYLIKFYA